MLTTPPLGAFTFCQMISPSIFESPPVGHGSRKIELPAPSSSAELPSNIALSLSLFKQRNFSKRVRLNENRWTISGKTFPKGVCYVALMSF